MILLFSGWSPDLLLSGASHRPGVRVRPFDVSALEHDGIGMTMKGKKITELSDHRIQARIEAPLVSRCHHGVLVSSVNGPQSSSSSESQEG